MSAPKLIGIDTGGTFTDAVVFSDADGVLAKAKALTTRRDLSVGIGEAMDAALAACAVRSDEIGLVCLSTTLATNAIVENLGERIGLVLIGFAEADLHRGGLRQALTGDRVLFLPGGHDAHGGEVRPLDLAQLPAWLEQCDGIGGFAVAGQFAVANPGHERTVRDLLVERTGLPVTCGHELSAQLNAPRRALTAVLNARLIGAIQHLIDTAQDLLAARGIAAPLMVVKGDGSLIAAAEARRKPVETILSGPAASLVGASWLTGHADALVADIGGTTTDVALLRGGRPRLDPQGARVGGWSTMVEAVAMHTVGLGGDSDVQPGPEGDGRPLRLGPRRVVPVSLFAREHGEAVHRALDRQLALTLPPEGAGRFALAAGRAGAPEVRAEGAVEAELLASLAAGPAPLDTLAPSRRHRTGLARLVGRGAARLAAFCPSDAAHVLGFHTAWDQEAARKAAALFARLRTARGEPLAADADSASREVIDTLVRRSAETLLDAGLAEDGFASPEPSAHPLVQAALAGRPALVRLETRLAVPVVALGASAQVYYPRVARFLNTEATIPAHADVANAVGAVVGHVRVGAHATISRPSDGVFRAHVDQGPRDFAEIEDAVVFCEGTLRAEVVRQAALNGAPAVEVSIRREEVNVELAGGELFLEMRLTATGVGRPALAQSPPGEPDWPRAQRMPR